jgi:hypothetical protein
VAEKYAIKTNDSIRLVVNYVHEGSAYLKAGMPDSALYYEQKAYVISKAISLPDDYWYAPLLFAYRGMRCIDFDGQ